MSRQLLRVVAGLTQASRVIPVVSWSEAELAMLTRALLPLKEREPPNLPLVLRVAFAIAPLLPLPDESMTVVPDPSSNEYAATRRDVGTDGVVAVLWFEYCPR